MWEGAGVEPNHTTARKLGPIHINSQSSLVEDMDQEGRASEPVFLNVYGAQESIPRNEFRQPM